MWEILKQIYELPWYQVIAIAIADDAIVFLKIWPAYIALIIIIVIFFFLIRQ